MKLSARALLFYVSFLTASAGFPSMSFADSTNDLFTFNNECRTLVRKAARNAGRLKATIQQRIAEDMEELDATIRYVNDPANSIESRRQNKARADQNRESLEYFLKELTARNRPLADRITIACGLSHISEPFQWNPRLLEELE